MTPFAATLNREQHAAATIGENDGDGIDCKPLLIIAGAGTGKTMTLAHRVAWLIQQGVDPGRLLLMTFSRRAAREMSQRAIRIASRTLNSATSAALKLAWAGTFHSMANRLSRIHAGQLGLDPGFSIIDSADAADQMDIFRHQLGLTRAARRFPKKATCRRRKTHHRRARVSPGRTL